MGKKGKKVGKKWGKSKQKRWVWLGGEGRGAHRSQPASLVLKLDSLCRVQRETGTYRLAKMWYLAARQSDST